MRWPTAGNTCRRRRNWASAAAAPMCRSCSRRGDARAAAWPGVSSTSGDRLRAHSLLSLLPLSTANLWLGGEEARQGGRARRMAGDGMGPSHRSARRGGTTSCDGLFSGAMANVDGGCRIRSSRRAPVDGIRASGCTAKFYWHRRGGGGDGGQWPEGTPSRAAAMTTTSRAGSADGADAVPLGLRGPGVFGGQARPRSRGNILL
uniref:Uncharacterized protein n=1 Tax=Leersia perrieri TaxID=77586 RepID=A0A0D9XQQ2_9ORYZ